MIPNEMKSWREVMDDVARLTKERDEALAEIARMREIESDDLRAARDDAIRLGKERDEARAEVERHRQTAHTLECDIRDARANRDKYKAEVARLRASQNERAIAELEKLREKPAAMLFDADPVGIPSGPWCHLDSVQLRIDDRIAALRAEAQAAPAKEPVPTEPAAPRVGPDAIACGGPIYSEVGKCDREFGHSGTCEPAAPQGPKSRTNKLFLVQDSERPMHVVATSWQHAVDRWVAQIRIENGDQDDYEPDGVMLVATEHEHFPELLLLDAEIARLGGAS